VLRAHLPPLRAEGTIDVEHGDGWLARRIVWLMKLPAAGIGQPTRLDLSAEGASLVWTRQIGATVLRTRQRARGAQIEERSGLGRITFDLSVENGVLVYRQASFDAAGIPVPAPICPRVGATVSATNEGWHVVVTVAWRDRMVCRYGGSMHAS